MNEVGHSKESQPNVFTREFDDRVVKYFFVPNEKMEIGKPVELLTNYKDQYEGTVLIHFFNFLLAHQVIPCSMSHRHSRASWVWLSQHHGRSPFRR